MSQRCPRCAATNPASAQLCGQCWVQLDPAPATATPIGTPAPAYASGAPPGWAPAPAPVGPPAWTPPLAGVPEQALAGVWPRVGAFVVDNLVLLVATLMAGFTLGIASLAVPGLNPMLDSDLFGLAVYLLVAIAYKTLMVANSGQTLAKMLFRLRVVRLDGSPPPLHGAFFRALVLTLLSVVPLALPVCAVVMERDRRRQGWHDKAAGTLVVSTRAASPW